jgi:FlaA1/EpsC-like NDP-sugar epimerase
MIKILITGSCGTIGSELITRVLNIFTDSEIFCLDNNESQLFFQEQIYLHEERIRFFLGDVRDLERLRTIMKGVDIVFHAAALKHVAMCERSPMDATQTNILGLNNVIQAASEAEVKKVIFTSSDKAVNPTNVMGTSKLMGERLITAANSSQHSGGTIFSSTRFGNVLGSTGSVVQIFRKQIENGGPVTLTHPDMTRFVMSVEQAVQLVVDSVELARGGEVFITKMPVIRIVDLAEVMIQELAPRYGHPLSCIVIEEVGTKPGEKLYEELMSEEETRRAVELQDYFSVLPAFKGIYRSINYDYENIISSEIDNPYISSEEKCLSKVQIHKFMIGHNLLKQSDKKEPDQRYWPGDKN